MAHLRPLISNFSSTRPFELIVGVDLQGTTVEGLTMLMDSLQQHGRAFIFHNNGSSTFHPKLFCFRYNNKADLYVGSGNFTEGGLFTNHEAGLALSLGDTEADTALLAQIDDSLDRWSIKAGNSARPLDQTLIDELVDCGLVVTEAKARANSSNSYAPVSAAAPGAPIFGAMSVPSAPAPLVNASRANPTASSVPVSAANTSPAANTSAIQPLNTSNRIFWIETKSMTGGSRNILDLSMRSLILKGDPKGTPLDLGEPGVMGGTVAFFGLNPTAINTAKDITLVFEDIDYTGNTILFPVGSNANGTWRLQVKGLSPSGEKITDAFRKKSQGYYLVKKIAHFEHIGKDRFALSVLDLSNLAKLQAASKILAYNGKTKNSKKIGFI